MTSARLLTTLCFAGFAALCAQSAWAFDSGWYGGLGLGLTQSKIDDERITAQLLGAGLATTSIDDDDRDIGYKVFGGFKINRNFALEAGYFNLGKFGFTATTNPPGTLTGSLKASGVNFDVVGILPFAENFSAFGRVGVQYAKVKDSFSGTGAATAITEPSPSKSGSNFKAGLGLQYDITDNVGLRTEWERYRINDAVGNHGDIDMISIGVVVMFGGGKSASDQRDAYHPAPEPAAAAAAAPTQKAAEPVAAAAPPPKQPEPVATGAAPPPPAAATFPLPGASPILVIVPVTRTQTYCSILDIQFEINADAIQREYQDRIDRVGVFMRKYPDTTAVIEGHTDEVGSAGDNLKLSQRRADSVVTYLANNFGIDRTRLKAVGYGASRPIADPHTEEGRRMNRRIGAIIACATDIEGLKPIPGRITMALDMEFDAKQADVKPQYREQLRKVATFMRLHPTVTATVEGHTGNLQATPQAAMEMSQRRAQAVVNYLVDNFGVARSRLSAEGFGQTRRFAYNTSTEGQQDNRRVNIIFNYPK